MTSSSPRRVDLPDGIPVRIRAFLGKGKGRILNLSSQGAYISTPMRLLPHAHVRLSIVLREEKRWVDADAIMVWENPDGAPPHGLPPGYGFRFIGLPEETASVIEKLLSGDGLGSEPLPPSDTVRLPTSSALDRDEPEGPPFRLHRETLETKAPAMPGIFVLSYDRAQVARVGRSDRDLRAALGAFEGEYGYFYCEVIEALEERFHRECELYHRMGGDHGQLDTQDHPAAPSGSQLDCPVCRRGRPAEREH